MQITLYGVRGSLPSGISANEMEGKIEQALELFLERGYSKKEDIKTFMNDLPLHQKGTYGSSTMCIEVRTESGSVLFDSGSGIRNYGVKYHKTEKEFHIFQTHYHWDHTCGLPFFIPIYMEGRILNFYSPHNSFQNGIRDLFKAPYFPVPYEFLPSTHHFHHVEKYKPLQLCGLEITPFQLDHPNESFGYHIQEGDKRVVICFDAEFKRMSRQDLGKDLEYYQNLNMILFDGQYTMSEVLRKIDWGHCTAHVGVDLCLREAIKKLVIVHHDPQSDDEHLYHQEQITRQYYDRQLRTYKHENPDISPVEIMWGYEGLVLQV
ncbi:MAG: MBL fold metallo-hydrolase [SAR324 cluster bacterium]|nr:MBL fold metallo-hydrolase [SAR324 cluster bacterium]